MSRTPRALLWKLGSVIAVALGVLALGWRTVTCSAAAPGGSGECITEPSPEQAIVIAGVCAGLAVFFAWRAVRARRAESPSRPPRSR